MIVIKFKELKRAQFAHCEFEGKITTKFRA